MATHNGPFDFKGSLFNLSFYHRRDSDKNLVRQKTGPTREQVLHDPRYALTRLNLSEWDGCSKGSKWIRRVLQPLDAVRDYNLAGTLTGLMKNVQKSDSTGLYGQRSVLLSQHPHLLQGFTMSRKTPLESLVRPALEGTVDKGSLSGRLEVPELRAGVNFHPRTPHPYFRIIATLGVVPDLHYTPHGYGPDEVHGQYVPQVAHTDWMGVKSGATASVLELALPYAVAFSSYSLVLALAVSFGTLDVLGHIKAVPYSGSGRIAAIA